jgi:hypothetical protein
MICDGIREDRASAENIACQFCGETDFDGYGLKLHLTFGWCRVFEALSPDKPSISAFQVLEDRGQGLADAHSKNPEAEHG